MSYSSILTVQFELTLSFFPLFLCLEVCRNHVTEKNCWPIFDLLIYTASWLFSHSGLKSQNCRCVHSFTLFVHCTGQQSWKSSTIFEEHVTIFFFCNLNLHSWTLSQSVWRRSCFSSIHWISLMGSCDVKYYLIQDINYCWVTQRMSNMQREEKCPSNTVNTKTTIGEGPETSKTDRHAQPTDIAASYEHCTTINVSPYINVMTNFSKSEFNWTSDFV